MRARASGFVVAVIFGWKSKERVATPLTAGGKSLGIRLDSKTAEAAFFIQIPSIN